VLSFRRLKARELAQILRDFLRHECEKFNLTGKIAGITTDSGSSIKSACKYIGFGTRLSCIGHDLNLIVANGLKLWKRISPTEEENAGQENYELENLTDVEDLEEEAEDDDPVVEENEDENDEQLVTEKYDSDEYECDSSDEDDENEPAASHEDDFDHHSACLYELNRVLKKIRSLVKMIRKSSILLSYVRKLVNNIDPSILYELITDFHVR